MNELYYVYPVFQKGSFHVISKNHINYLNNHIKVQELDEQVLDNIMWLGDKHVLLHPIGYLLLGDRIEMFSSRIKRFYKLKNVSKRLGGFDTADSSKISKTFVQVLNELDLVIVPSTWAKNSFVNSGVETSVEVLPHGLNNSFLSNNKKITNDVLKELIKLKQKHKAKLVLYFLYHSGFRKGADFVAKAIKQIQEEEDNVFLVVKTGEGLDPYLGDLLKLKTIHIKGWFNDDELRQLYDVCDVCICPSRGGGFELNALEGISRGLPTLVPNGMCFSDYIDYTVPIKLNNSVTVLPNNPLHIGDGYEIQIDDFINKLKKVLDNLHKYKRKFNQYSKQIRKKYSWAVICDKLFDMLKRYDFV